MAKRYWLIKSEPSVYSFSQLQREGRTAWTGVRNFEARNNLKAMRPGDACLYYHSGEEKAVVGVARVASPPGPDPTAPGEDWAAVDVEAGRPLAAPVTLAQVKKDEALAKFPLVTRSRLSVAPVAKEEFERVLELGGKRGR